MRRVQVISILVVFAVAKATAWTIPREDIVFATTPAPSVTTQPVHCVNGKRVRGTCVKRSQCDYGTAAIDFSLYRPRGYKESCSIEEVCCPPECIVQQDETVWVPQTGVLDFDDDD